MAARIPQNRVHEAHMARAHLRALVPAEHSIEDVLSPGYWSTYEHRLTKVDHTDIEIVHEALDFEMTIRVRRYTKERGAEVVVLRLEEPMTAEAAVAKWRARKPKESLPPMIKIVWNRDNLHTVQHSGQIASLDGDPLAGFTSRAQAVEAARLYSIAKGLTHGNDKAQGDEPDAGAAEAGAGPLDKPRGRGRPPNKPGVRSDSAAVS